MSQYKPIVMVTATYSRNVFLFFIIADCKQNTFWACKVEWKYYNVSRSDVYALKVYSSSKRCLHIHKTKHGVPLSWNRTWTFHWYTWPESTIVWTYCLLVYIQVKGTPNSGMRTHHFIFSSQLIYHNLVLRLLRVVDTGLEMTKVSAAQLIARLWSYSCAWSFHVNYYCIRWMKAKVL